MANRFLNRKEIGFPLGGDTYGARHRFLFMLYNLVAIPTVRDIARENHFCLDNQAYAEHSLSRALSSDRSTPKRIKHSLRSIAKFSLLTLFLFTTLQLRAVTWLEPNQVYHPRSLAMGNAFFSVSNDEFALFSNPAGLRHNPKFGQAKDKGIISLFEVGIKINQDLQSLTKFYSDNKDSLSDPSALDSETIDKILGIKAGLGVQGPLSMGYIGKNWGIALVDNLNVKAVLGREAPLPLLHLSGTGHLSLTSGIAFAGSLERKDDIWLGVAVKTFFRGDISKDVSLFDLTTIADNIEEQFIFGNGFGLDFGILHRITPQLDLALGVRDAPTVVTKSFFGTFGVGTNRNGVAYVKPNMVTGLSWRPNISFMHKFVPDWLIERMVLSFDYSNYFDNNYSFFTRLHAGMEIAALFNHLFLRFGINQGYFTYGFGLDFVLVQVNFVRYRQELGAFPGDLLEESTILTISSRF